MSFSLPNLFTFNMIENDLYRIFKKHDIRYRKDTERRSFVIMIAINGDMYFEIYEDNTYITFETKVSHVCFDNRHPNDIYDAAEMIGFLQGGY